MPVSELNSLIAAQLQLTDRGSFLTIKFRTSGAGLVSLSTSGGWCLPTDEQGFPQADTPPGRQTPVVPIFKGTLWYAGCFVVP